MDSNTEPIEPISIDQNANSFQANGHTYHINRTGRLSMVRDEWLDTFGFWAMMGRQASAFLTEQQRLFGLLNQGQVAEAAVVSHNLINGARDLITKKNPLYYICSLFINREGEDTQAYSLDYGEQKIKDWAKHDAFFFKQLGLSLLETTELDWSTLIQSISVSLPNLQLQSE